MDALKWRAASGTAAYRQLGAVCQALRQPASLPCWYRPGKTGPRRGDRAADGVFEPTPRSNAQQEVTSRPAGRLVADGEGLDAFLERAQARERGGLARRPTHA